MNDLIPKLIDIAGKAGDEILRVYAKAEHGVEYKEDKSPLTEADKASHLVITEGLRALTPDIPVISEESVEVPYSERKSWRSFWLVDPLDGTKEFIKRNGEFTVNIALVKGRMPVFGMILIPVRGRLYYGGDGVGAFRMDFAKGTAERIRSGSPARKPIAAVSRSHLSEKTKKIVEGLDAETVTAGSALKFTLIAEGEADFYPRIGPTWEWDTAAGHAIAEAAGACVSRPDGQELIYNKVSLKHDGFVVCAPGFKDRVIAQIAKIKDT